MRSLLAIALGFVLFFTAGLARAVSYPCTEAGLDSALAAGGVATFACAANTVVTVSGAKTISVSGTNLDGGGKLTISGGDLVVPLTVNAGVTAGISNLTIEHGKSAVYGSNLVVNGTLTLKDSTIQKGTDSGGGAIHVPGGGTLNASGISVIANTTGPEGAAAVHGTATFINSTFSGINFRGVTCRFGGQVTISYSTIVTNVGEALFVVDSGSSITASHNLLVTPANTPSLAASGPLTSLGYNMVSTSGTSFTTAAVTDQFDVRPLLGALADNGGPTLTHAFLACSPGINAGNTTGGPATDQRGQPRLQNGAHDIGAYESNALPCLTIDDVATTEGNAGSKALTFDIHVSGKSTLGISVPYSFADGTAKTADGDYTAISGVLAIPSGGLSASISAQINGDTSYEPNETFTAVLGVPTNATLSDGTATGTITNDDTAPALSIGDVSIAEGTGGTTTVDVTVTLTGSSTQTTTVDFATVEGTATAGTDYTTKTGTLTFAPSVTTQKITIDITPDAIKEANEAFTVHLTNPANASIAIGTATVTITDDEGNPGLSISDVSVTEGNAGTSVVTLTVSLSPASATNVAVDWSTADGTATVADSDYENATGTLTFSSGDTAKTIDITINGDTKVEATETFTVHLSNSSGANIAVADGTVTITNDDVEDAGVDAGTADDASTDAGTPVDAGGPSGLDAGGTGGNDASTPPPGSGSSSGAVGLGDGGLSIAPSGGSSDDDCSVAVVGGNASSDFALLAAPLAVMLAFARRRRRR